jgi:hypothetical protein
VEIIVTGICCWVDASPPRSGKTVIIRNALGGGTRRGSSIPPHFAFIHGKRDEVDATRWGVGWAGGDDNVFFYLTGDRLMFDPTPTGGSIDISLLPHVAARITNDPICAAADEIRHGFRENPSTANVLALIDLPSDADVECGVTERGAAYASLKMPQVPVTITATPFADSDGVPRSLTITDPNARIFIANVNMPEYVTGIGAPDDDHKYLVCDIFKPRAVASEPMHFLQDGPMAATTLSVAAAQTSELERVSLSALRSAANRQMGDFLSTLAAGCSSSQWP